MAIGTQLNLDDLSQDFKWGLVTLGWVIHKTSWEEGSELGLKGGDTSERQRFMRLHIDSTPSDAVPGAETEREMIPRSWRSLGLQADRKVSKKDDFTKWKVLWRQWRRQGYRDEVKVYGDFKGRPGKESLRKHLSRKGGNHPAEQKSTGLWGVCLAGSLRLQMFKRC